MHRYRGINIPRTPCHVGSSPKDDFRCSSNRFTIPASPWDGETARGWANWDISFFLPVDISSAAGCCQNSGSHAKAQRRKVRTEGSLFQQFSFAPLREVKAGIDEPFENGLIGIISFCLPVSLTPFHHPRAKLLLLRVFVALVQRVFCTMIRGLPPRGGADVSH